MHGEYIIINNNRGEHPNKKRKGCVPPHGESTGNIYPGNIYREKWTPPFPRAKTPPVKKD